MSVHASYCPLDCPDRCSLDVTVEDGRLQAKAEPTPEALVRLRERGDEEPEEQPSYPLAILADDKYVVADGPARQVVDAFVSRAAPVAVAVS